MSEPKGTSDQSIGRPDQWKEGRYEKAGQPVDESVADPTQRDDKSHDDVSTTVTRKDYEDLTPPDPPPRRTGRNTIDER